MLGAVIPFLSFYLVASAPCTLSVERGHKATVRYSAFHASIDIISSQAKLNECRVWKEFPTLLVVDVNLGSSGTKYLSTDHYLFVFDTTKTEASPLVKVLVRSEEEIVQKKKPTDTTQKQGDDGRTAPSIDDNLPEIVTVTTDREYKLLKGSKGQAEIHLKKPQEVIQISLKP